MDRKKYLDGVRAIAILGVLFAHFITPDFINLGRAGVELFFVLSGRLMAQILFLNKQELTMFYWRRFSRVWATIFIFLVTVSVFGYLNNKNGYNFLSASSVVFYFYNYLSLFSDRIVQIDHIWSLCVEEHTYIILGLVAWLTKRNEEYVIKILFALIVLCFADAFISTYFLNLDYYHTYWRTDVRMASILLGAITFLLSANGKFRLSGNIPVILGIVGIVLNINLIPDFIKYSVGSVCIALSVSNLDNSKGVYKTILENKVFMWLGLVSFSLYIWQQPFAQLHHGSHSKGVILILVSIAISSIFYKLVENPIRIYLNNNPPFFIKRPIK